MEEKIWEQLNLTDVNRLIEKMMPEYNVSFSDVAMALTAGHFSKAAGMLRDAFLQVVFPGFPSFSRQENFYWIPTFPPIACFRSNCCRGAFALPCFGFLSSVAFPFEC